MLNFVLLFLSQVVKENLFVASSGEMGQVGESQNYDDECDDEAEHDSVTERPREGLPEGFIGML